MMNFCTLFDSYYIHKGLALYQSLINVTDDFHLYVMAFDKESYLKLGKLNLSNMSVTLLDDFETPELLAVKSSRNKAEYCWTCVAPVLHYFIKKYELESCTYLDSDLMFFSSPQVVFDEIGDNSIALSPHFITGDLVGKFCVQFIYFRNNEQGIKALTWWQDKCIDWCSAKYEDGKFGNQKYLDDIPGLFGNVCIIKNRGVGVAPWNMNQYSYLIDNNSVSYNGRNYEIVFFHFHGTGINVVEKKLQLNSVDYDINKEESKMFFYPYLKLLKDVYSRYLDINIEEMVIRERSLTLRLYFFFKSVFRHNSIVQFFYYKVFGLKYNGYEQRK